MGIMNGRFVDGCEPCISAIELRDMMPEFFYVSLLAEIVLSLILLFIWLPQRQEKHALFWGIAQLSLTFMTLYWHESQAWFGQSPFRWIMITALVGGMAAYWHGTRFFLGRANAGWKIWVRFGLLGSAIYLWEVFPVLGMKYPGALVLGMVMLWCGWHIAREQHAYRWAGWLLMFRGVTNILIMAALDSAATMEWFFLLAFFAKIGSALGLVYAVLHESRQRYTNAMGRLNDGFVVMDAHGQICQTNQAQARMLGLSSTEDLQGKSVYDVFPNVRYQDVFAVLAKLRDPNTLFPIVIEWHIERQGGHSLPVELSITPYQERGRTSAMVQMRDISERKRHESLLVQAANTDNVSELANRHALNQYLSQVIPECLAAGQECALLFIDLDHFKRINDTLGHAMGDVLLRQAGLRLQTLASKPGFVARFGGDEFVVVLAYLPAASARPRAQHLAAQIIKRFAEPFVMERISIAVTPSIGISLCPEHGQDTDSLLRFADIAMYAAKTGGRNEVRFFDEAMNQAARSEIEMNRELHLALSRQEFCLVYQPIVDALSQHVKKVEVLLRWNSTVLGSVPPDRFIPVAEESELIVMIGEWVLREACKQAAMWRTGSLASAIVSVNVSADQLADVRFFDLVRSCLAEYDLPASRLELELTERVLIEEDDSTRTNLLFLQAMGVRISLDDFGTGYSSLNYLTRFQLDTLKIDRSFICDLEHNGRSRHLAQAIVAMGKSLEIQLVAEGVETAEQAHMLQAMGCHYLQGYYFSKPLSAEALLLAYAA